MVAVNHDTALRIGRQVAEALGKLPEGHPFVARNPADGQFLRFAAINKPWAFVFREIKPGGDGFRGNFGGFRRVWQ